MAIEFNITLSQCLSNLAAMGKSQKNVYTKLRQAGQTDVKCKRNNKYTAIYKNAQSWGYLFPSRPLAGQVSVKQRWYGADIFGCIVEAQRSDKTSRDVEVL